MRLRPPACAGVGPCFCSPRVGRPPVISYKRSCRYKGPSLTLLCPVRPFVELTAVRHARICTLSSTCIVRLRSRRFSRFTTGGLAGQCRYHPRISPIIVFRILGAGEIVSIDPAASSKAAQFCITSPPGEDVTEGARDVSLSCKTLSHDALIGYCLTGRVGRMAYCSWRRFASFAPCLPLCSECANQINGRFPNSKQAHK